MWNFRMKVRKLVTVTCFKCGINISHYISVTVSLKGGTFIWLYCLIHGYTMPNLIYKKKNHEDDMTKKYQYQSSICQGEYVCNICFIKSWLIDLCVEDDLRDLSIFNRSSIVIACSIRKLERNFSTGQRFMGNFT